MNYLEKIKYVIEKDVVIQKKYDIYKNSSLVNTYFEVGRLLVETQEGKIKIWRWTYKKME